MLLIIFISLLICGNFEFSFAQCNTCGTGNVACLSKNTFHMCLGGKPMPSMGTHTCDGDTVCVSSNQARCLPAATPPSCGANCAVCNAVTHSSCTDYKKFALCKDNLPSTSVGECPETYVCNSASSEICVLETSAEGPTCPPPPPTEEPPTGGPPPNEPTNPTEFCKAQTNIRHRKKYPVPGNCKRYNYCYIIDSQVRGLQYACPPTQEFNCQTESCGPTCVPC